MNRYQITRSDKSTDPIRIFSNPYFELHCNPGVTCKHNGRCAECMRDGGRDSVQRRARLLLVRHQSQLARCLQGAALRNGMERMDFRLRVVALHVRRRRPCPRPRPHPTTTSTTAAAATSAFSSGQLQDCPRLLAQRRVRRHHWCLCLRRALETWRQRQRGVQRLRRAVAPE
jgi:hypothetical protein